MAEVYEAPRRLVFIGILNDTDQTGQEAVSHIADLMFHKKAEALITTLDRQER